MSISINTSIPACSRYVLFIDVPYRFSARHFSAAFEQATPRSLLDRVCHFMMGTFLLLPIINLVIAATERYFDPPPIPNLSFPLPSSNKTPKVNGAQKMTPEKRIKTSLCELEKAWRANPHIIANHNEIRAPKGPSCYLFDTFNPFLDCLETGKTEAACILIQDPHFKGHNLCYSVQIRSMNSTSHADWFPLAVAARHKQMPIFKMLLEHPETELEPCSLSARDNSPLMRICELGTGYEDFIEKLIEKGACPVFRERWTNREVSALDLAKQSNVAAATLANLEAWHDLNKADEAGDNDLQQAVKKSDLSAFEEALKKGVCLNNRNWSGQTALHLAVSQLSKPDSAAVAKTMIDRLLEKGAQLNIQGWGNSTPLLDLVFAKPPGWEDLAIRLLEQGANPDISSDEGTFASQSLLTYPSTHPVKTYLLKQSDGLHSFYQNQFDMATVLGSVISIDITGKRDFAAGGNYSEAIYELLAAMMDQFLNDPNTSTEIQELFSSAKEASILAKEISFMSDPGEIIKKIQAARHPVLIPSGWSGHAISLTVYNDQLICANVGDRPRDIEGGLRRYQILRNLFEQTSFPTLIKYNMHRSTIKHGDHYYTQLKDLGCDYQSTLTLPDQIRGNCTWASSALLGLHSVLVIQNKWDSEKIVQALEQFNQFAQSFLVLKTLNYLKDNISKLPLPLYPNCLSSSAHWLCKQIQESKDSFGYYRKALDAITFSGFRLDYIAFLEEPKIEFYAGLYNMSKQAFQETLMQEPYVVNNWIPS